MAVMNQARRKLTVRAIKRAIGSGEDVDWWVLKAYAQIDAGVITSDDMSEIETLANAYYDALAAEEASSASSDAAASGE